MAINIKQLDLENSSGSTAEASVPASAANDNVATGLNKEIDISFLQSKKVSANDRMFFTEQLSLLLDTGNSLLESLHILTRHGQRAPLKKLITELASDVEQGRPFSQALAKHPGVFSTTYTNLIKASEQGGFMADVLDELMEMDEKRSKLQSTMQSALSYPVFLMVFSVLVVIFVLVVVFPKFAEMFGSMADRLPATTKALMAFSNSLISYWPVYLGGTLLLAGAVYAFCTSAKGRLLLDDLKLKAPIAKGIYSELYLVQSMRVMALSMGRGVSIMDTLAACRDVIPNQRYRNFFLGLENDLQEGRGLSRGFRNADFLPDVVKQMVSTGEASGSLPKVMARIASYYERQLEKRLNMVAKAAEPIMLIVMGAVVGVLVSSLILPIFQMSSGAH